MLRICGLYNTYKYPVRSLKTYLGNYISPFMGILRLGFALGNIFSVDAAYMLVLQFYVIY